MEDLNKTAYFYRKKFAAKEAQYNKPSKLPDYFESLIGDKKEVLIAEVGAGPINTIGNEWPGVEVEIIASDVLWPEYEKLWAEYGKTPIVPVHYQDFEHLLYPDNHFDIVHCVNALDHTHNPRLAILELLRICKPGGFVYLKHAPDQRKRYGGMHEWDINEVNGHCLFTNPKDRFFISEFGDFQIHKEDDLIVAICKKTSR